MASFWGVFQGADMGRRFLRYALSRLDMLDTDVMDIDNLDFAIGRNTVFEFRDVGVMTKKVEKMLQLPPSVILDKARTLLVKVTFPIDFYASPIVVEVTGVRIKFTVDDNEPKSSRTPGTKTPARDLSDMVPDPADLAMSFLQTQPGPEVRELENALAAETQDVEASISRSESSDDDDLAYGTGQPLTLPQFLTDWIQGIMDRMIVKIKDVSVQFDIQVPTEPNSNNLEKVSFQVGMEDMDIEGVTTNTPTSEDSPAFEAKEGKRRITLTNLRAYLISEANVFSALARSPSMTSPSVPSSPAVARSFSRQPTMAPQPASRSPYPPSLQGSFHASVPASESDDESEPAASMYESTVYDALGASSASQRSMPPSMQRSLPTVEEPADEDEPETVASMYESMFHPSNNPLQLHQRTPSPSTQDLFPPPGNDNESEMSESIYQSVWSSSSHAQLAQEEELSTPKKEQPPLFVEEDHTSPPHEEQDSSLYEEKRASSPAQEELESAPDEQEPVSTTEGHQISSLEKEKDSSLSEQEQASPHHEKQQVLPPLEEGHDLDPPTPSLTASRQLIDSTEESTEAIHSSQHTEVQPTPESPSPPQIQESTLPSAMPGAWGLWSETESPLPRTTASFSGERLRSSHYHLGDTANQSDSDISSPAFSRANIAEDVPVVEPSSPDSKHQDDVETPKGPTRLVKEIFNLKQASVYLPSQHHEHVHIEAPSPQSANKLSQSLRHSVYPQAPGAFSVHGTSFLAHEKASAHDASSSQQQGVHADSGVDNVIEVDVSPIIINFDASLGFLLTMVVKKLLESLKDNKSGATKSISKPDSEKSDGRPPEFKLNLQELSLNFLNRLGGVSDTPDRYLDPSAFMFDEEVLLRMSLKDINISCSHVNVPLARPTRLGPFVEPGTEFRLNLGKFRLGYSDGDIMSFDGTMPMTASVMDTFMSPDSDIGIKVTQTLDKITTDVSTLPLVVQIDLQRLDETFSWFGGLSSFLNMSASMTSSPSPTPRTPTSPQKPKGVRFNTAIDPQDQSASSQNKVNVRIGGSRLELIGKECRVAAKTTALKLICREEGIGLGCNTLQVAGPYLRNSMADPAIEITLRGLLVNFATKPSDEDLEKLLELITPSKVKFDQSGDEIMVDTLLRQRRKGSVLKVTLDTFNVDVKNMAQLTVLPNLGEEVSKLATVAKYLPEDDRPGLLTLATLKQVGIALDFGGKIGRVGAELDDFQLGHITVPALVAAAVFGITAKRNETEELITSKTFGSLAPVLRARMIGDEIEPLIRLRMRDLNVEYRVSTILDLLDLGQDATPQDFDASLAASIVNLGDQAHNALAQSPSEKSKASKPMTLDIGFSDCFVGLNPYQITSKMVVALTDANLNVVLPKGGNTSAVFGVKRASVFLIDDVSSTKARLGHQYRTSASSSPRIDELCRNGYVDICFISTAQVDLKVVEGPDDGRQIRVAVRDDLLVLQTCADSTQTLISLTNALKPPTPPSEETKFKTTNLMPVENLMDSVNLQQFDPPEGGFDFDDQFPTAGGSSMDDSSEYDQDSPLQVHSDYYGQRPGDTVPSFSRSSTGPKVGKGKGKLTDADVLFDGDSVSQKSDSVGGLSIHDDFYNIPSHKYPLAKLWNEDSTRLDIAPDDLVDRCPIQVSVQDVHVIWKLFDGFDWIHTRDVIEKAVNEVEQRAFERQARLGPHDEEDTEEEVNDFLFNSIYIGIPSSRDPAELAQAINAGLGGNDTTTETESVATTAITATSNASRWRQDARKKTKKLKLKRSRTHKISFELSGVNAEVYMYPEGTTVNSIDVKVQKLDIIDNIETSTWRKFATYDQDFGQREMGSSMVHLEILSFKPLLELPTTEFVIRASILPLRLHVDQDALDFITRFFEFKDDATPTHISESDVPFVYRAEVNAVPVKLDFKPKRVDYAGLRSGHTSEFMNFVNLEEANLVLRRVILYGVPGFDRLGQTLNKVWTNDVTGTQLPTVLAGVAMVRPLVNVTAGVKELVEVPIREYKKDGRIVRSISKGAAAFLRTTGTGIVKLSAKVAVGTQNMLENAEGMLVDAPPQHTPEHLTSWEEYDEDDFDSDKKKHVSLYANQPAGFVAGVYDGYRSLARDVQMAHGALVAIPTEVMESQSATKAAKAVLRHAPTIVFRPALGVTKAVGQALMGATNTIDPQNRRRMSEKYKKH